MIASHAEAHRSVNTRIPSIVSVRIEVPGAISEYAYLLYAVTIPVTYDGNITSHAIRYAGIFCWISRCSSTNPRTCARLIQIPGSIPEYAYLCFAVSIPVTYDGNITSHAEAN